MSRLLRVVNLSIAVLLIAFVAAAYWYAWRALPETSGEMSAPIAAKATITRDALGVPHIRAESWEDAIFLQGYAMAQDRLWQMDAMRRRAAGELAEVVGPAALPADEEARRFRMRRLAEQHEKTLAPEERKVFAEFARGVNHYIATHRGRLPLEFTLLSYDPRPWTIRDSILAGLEMYRFLTPNWRAELAKMHMLAQGDREKVEFLFPVRTGGEPQPGSNAWAIAGARTATGRPILANDPHLEMTIPSVWYLMHLQAPGLDVTGGAIIGLPCIIVGHNQRIAWGLTNLEFDVQDLYREQIDLQSGRYVFQGKTEQARLERETMAVDGAEPRATLVWVTRHGPVFVNDQERPYSLRWTAAEPGGFAFPFLGLNRAANWDEFRAAISHFAGPAQNFIYADVDGNIGYQAGGRLPVRNNCRGDVPADGAAGDCEWQSYVPFEELPHVFNPPTGVIASANQNPFPAEEFQGRAPPAAAPNGRTGFNVNGNFAPPYRVRQIRDRLASRLDWKAEDMIGVQTDVYSSFHHFLAQQLVAAWEQQKPSRTELADAAAELRQWNGQMEIGQAAPMIATLVFEQLRKVAAERAAAGQGDAYIANIAPAALERLLRERPQAWFPDYNALLLRCLTGAVDEGIKTQGSKISRWDFGRHQTLRLINPVLGRLPLIGGYFNIGPVPMRSSPVSVQQYTGRLGPSLRMAVDLSDLNHSFAGITLGQSEQWLSSHYKDQWDAFYRGRTFPMQFGKVEAKAVLTIRPGN